MSILLLACSMNKWIERYNKKVPEGFKRDERFELFYSPTKGFAEMADTGEMIFVNQVCGELKFWRALAEKLAELRGRNQLGTICVRPILPYLRLAGVKIKHKDEAEFGERYFFEDKKTGQKGCASPTDKGYYFITWEVI